MFSDKEDGMGSIGSGSSSVQSYIDEWKSTEVKAIVGELEKYYQKEQEWRETKSFSDRMRLEQSIPQVYLSVSKRNYANEESKNNTFNKLATELVDAHFKALKDKVEKNVGEITKITRVGGANDYIITGTSGETVKIQVVMAGGYNKQRLHTRWIQNRLGGRK